MKKNVERLSFKEKLAYGMGDAACQLTFGVIGSFITMFFTDILGLTHGSIMTLMFVIRIWDGVNDPIWGWIIDRGKAGKHGKYRKFLLYASTPLAIAGVLVFTYIPNLAPWQYLVWAYVSYMSWEMLYTIMNIPYGSLAGVMTPRIDDRADLSLYRSLGSGVGALPAAVLLPLFVYSQSDAGVKYLDSKKLLIGVAALAAASIIISLFSFKNVRERTPAVIDEKPKLSRTLMGLLRNRPFIVLSVASMLSIGVQMYMTTINGYLFKDYFNEPGMFSLYAVVQYAPMVLIVPFIGKLVKRFGKKELSAYGSLVTALSFVVLYIIKTDNPWIYFAFSFIGGFGMIFFVTEVWALVTDVIDYQEFITKQREDATAYAVYSFFRKLGHTLAGVGGTALLALIGYITSEGDEVVVQSGATVEGIYNVATLVPIIAFALIFIMLNFAYPLNKQKLAELQENLESKRKSAETELMSL